MRVTLDTELMFANNTTHITAGEDEYWDIDPNLINLAALVAKAVIGTAGALFPNLGRNVGREAFLQAIIGHLNAQIGDPK